MVACDGSHANHAPETPTCKMTGQACGVALSMHYLTRHTDTKAKSCHTKCNKACPMNGPTFGANSINLMNATQFKCLLCEGEDVVKCVFILRNVLHFLNYGVPGFDRMPPLLMDNPYDVFVSAANTQFRNCVQNLKDFHD